jgi:hypothetical protein
MNRRQAQPNRRIAMRVAGRRPSSSSGSGLLAAAIAATR